MREGRFCRSTVAVTLCFLCLLPACYFNKEAQEWEDATLLDFVTVHNSDGTEIAMPPLAAGEPYLKTGPPLGANYKNGWTVFDEGHAGYEVFFDGSILASPTLIVGANFVPQGSANSRWLDYGATTTWSFLLSVSTVSAEPWNPEGFLFVKGAFQPVAARIPGLGANGGYYLAVLDFSSIAGFSTTLIEQIELAFTIPKDKSGSIRLVNLWEHP